MGFRISWIAIQARTKAEVLALFNGTDSMEPDDCFESRLTMADLKTNWCLIVSSDYEYVDSLDFSKLSSDMSLVAVEIHEGVMHSSAALWKDGKRHWFVDHQGDEGPMKMNLKFDGELPAGFDAVRQDAETRQRADNDVDFMFDVPLQMAENACGFRHDEFDPELFVGAPTAVTIDLPKRPRKKFLGLF